MMQIGNFHVGKADSATPPTLTIAEAGIVWDMLSARYKCIEETNYYFAYAHDADFKEFISRFGLEMIKGQIDELEKQCEAYGIPMPPRPPKSITQSDGIAYSDEFMFRQIFEGCQHFLWHIPYCISSIVENDALRMIFINFFNDELNIFNNLCKYGKVKGWLHVQPTYKPN